MTSSIYETPQGNQRELAPKTDFDVELDQAFAIPLQMTLNGQAPISPEDLAHREKYFSSKASLPEDMPIKSYESPAERYAVSTDNPATYPLLLAQAMRKLEIAKGLGDPGLEITPHLEKVSRHEVAHGLMAQEFGVRSRYGIRVLYDPNENIWAVSPFHSLVGNEAGKIMLTRLQEAAIAVAPEDASPGDLFTARSLGYSSRDEVLTRLYEIRPDLKPGQ